MYHFTDDGNRWMYSVRWDATDESFKMPYKRRENDGLFDDLFPKFTYKPESFVWCKIIDDEEDIVAEDLEGLIGCTLRKE